MPLGRLMSCLADTTDLLGAVVDVVDLDVVDAHAGGRILVRTCVGYSHVQSKVGPANSFQRFGLSQSSATSDPGYARSFRCDRKLVYICPRTIKIPLLGSHFVHALPAPMKVNAVDRTALSKIILSRGRESAN
jgi:hypothetical protein